MLLYLRPETVQGASVKRSAYRIKRSKQHIIIQWLLQAGVVGLPNVGKLALFNYGGEGNSCCKAQASNYRFWHH